MTVTKMHNIAGISTTESQKASDLFMKCQYLDEITGARGVTFATGTPISNSIGEIREGDEYTGYRVALTADFPPMAVPLKLDITTGDKITPREIQYDYKLMLEDRHIQVMAFCLSDLCSRTCLSLHRYVTGTHWSRRV